MWESNSDDRTYRGKELYTSDELFLTGTAGGVTPVREVEGRIIGNGEWPMTHRLKTAYEDVTHGRNQKYANWLSPVSPLSVSH